MPPIDAETPPSDEAPRSETPPPVAGLPRVALWLSACLVLCPLVAAVPLLGGDPAWRSTLAASGTLAAALFELNSGIGKGPGYVAETLSVMFAVGLAALGPALCMGLSERTWSDRAASAAALLPVWTVVMLAPALVVYEYARTLDGSALGAHLSADFLMLFSATATSIALAYALWVRLHPDVYGRNRALPARAAARRLEPDAIRPR